MKRLDLTVSSQPDKPRRSEAPRRARGALVRSGARAGRVAFACDGSSKEPS